MPLGQVHQSLPPSLLPFRWATEAFVYLAIVIAPLLQRMFKKRENVVYVNTMWSIINNKKKIYLKNLSIVLSKCTIELKCLFHLHSRERHSVNRWPIIGNSYLFLPKGAIAHCTYILASVHSEDAHEIKHLFHKAVIPGQGCRGTVAYPSEHRERRRTHHRRVVSPS